VKNIKRKILTIIAVLIMLLIQTSIAAAEEFRYEIDTKDGINEKNTTAIVDIEQHEIRLPKFMPNMADFLGDSFEYAEGDTVPEPEQVEVTVPVPEPTPEPVSEPESEPIAEPVAEPAEVEEETPAEVTEPTPTPVAEEMLILNSVAGIPDTLRVTFSLNGRDVAVVKGHQILHQESFPVNEKTFLKIKLQGEGKLVGAKFNFQLLITEPITEPVPPVEPLGGSPVGEPEQQEITEGDITEVEEETEPEIPTEDEETIVPEEDAVIDEGTSEDEPTGVEGNVTEGDITEGTTEDGEPAEVNEDNVTEGEADVVEGDSGVADGEGTTETGNSDVSDTDSDVAETDSGDIATTESADGDVADSGDTAGGVGDTGTEE